MWARDYEGSPFCHQAVFNSPNALVSYFAIADLQQNQPFVLQKIGFPSFIGIRNSNWDFYVQDNWKVTPNLTLNLGVRYDYNMSPYLRGGGIDGLTNRFTDDGVSLFGAGRPKGGNIFDGWLIGRPDFKR